MFSVGLSSKRTPSRVFYPNGQNLIQSQVSSEFIEAGLRSCHDNVIFLNIPYSLPPIVKPRSVSCSQFQEPLFVGRHVIPIRNKCPKCGFMGTLLFTFVSRLAFSTVKLHKTVF